MKFFFQFLVFSLVLAKSSSNMTKKHKNIPQFPFFKKLWHMISPFGISQWYFKILSFLTKWELFNNFTLFGHVWTRFNQCKWKKQKLGKKISWFLTPPEGPSFYPHISALGWLIKNRLDDPKSMPGGTKHAKFHDSTMFRLGCRGGGLLKGVAHLLFGSNLYRDFLGAITCAA